MSIKIWGAILLLSGCCWIGFQFTRSYMIHENTLKQLIRSMQYMKCELPYRLTPLPELCLHLSTQCTGLVKKYFWMLSNELENQAAPDVEKCSDHTIAKLQPLSTQQNKLLKRFGTSIGQFNLSGQLQSIDAFLKYCEKRLQVSEANRPSRVRNYQTLALCAGAALVILFI